jgi:hypothetical protein
MTKRAEAKGARPPRDPYNWYREPRSSVDQLFDAMSFGNDLIWDPCCGSANILDVAQDRGHPTIGSDVIDRHKPRPHRFYRGNFLELTRWPKMPGRRLSIVSNPPYGRQGGYASISNEIIHRALHMIPFHRAAFLLPIEFLCSSGRYAFFQNFKPSHVAYCSERPSMPPGALVSALGDDAFDGGMADYCWIIWTAPDGGGPHRWRTESIWLRPSGL